MVSLFVDWLFVLERRAEYAYVLICSARGQQLKIYELECSARILSLRLSSRIHFQSAQRECNHRAHPLSSNYC
jgi:hypothetical protein